MSTRMSIALTIGLSLTLTDALATSVGRTAGQFAVSSVGSAQYSIPIWAPPGPRGMQPNISLFYDSGSPIGPLGVGWSIAGLGQITRCNKTVAQDTNAAPVALVVSDGYCINGSRLRLTSGTYGTAGSVYQTEIADFSQITAEGTEGNGPSYFVVQSRNGLTYYYGYTDSNNNGTGSQVIADGSSPQTALTWLLSKVIDRSGNNYVINYTNFSGTLIGTAVPSSISWTPAGAGSATYNYTMQFNYEANVPQSSTTKYIGGTLLSNPKLLSSIEILSSGAVVKDYFLTYSGSPTTSREELTQVLECADSSKSNCLLPTSITYGGPTRGVSTSVNTALGSSGAYLTARYDLNGDGYPDLVYESANGSAWYVVFGSPSGYGSPTDIGINSGVNGNVLIGRVTGGAQDSVLANNGGTWWSYVWNGASFTGTSTGIAYDATSYGFQLADINGDGLPDLIDLDVSYNKGTGYSTATVNTRLNTSSGGTVSFSSTVTDAFTVGSLASAQLQTSDTQYNKLRRFDFNGDGLDDLVLMVVTGKSPNYNLTTYELLSTGTAFTAARIASASGSTYTPIYFTNWNDDACTDYVSTTTLYVSGCNGTVPATLPIGTVLGAMDWDGDGRTDLVVANGSTLGVYLSTGTGSSSLVTTEIAYTSNCVYITMDVNADGMDDLGCWSQTGSGAVTYYLHNGTPDLATQFKDGFGNSASPTYVPLSQSSIYSEHYNNAMFPDQDYIGPLYVVSEALYSDPSSASGATYNQTFKYFGAWINLEGRGFEGFGAIEKLDSRNSVYDLQYYSTVFPYTGMRYQDDVSNATFTFVQTKCIPASTTVSGTTNQQRYFRYFSECDTNTWEVGGSENADLITTTNVAYTYDNYGNATDVITTVTDNDPGSPYNGVSWSTDVINTTDISVNQSADLAAWCLTMLDEQQIIYESTLSGATTVTRTKTFTPDSPSACRIKTAVTEPSANSGLYKVTEALTFDGFGNVATDTVTGANMPSSPANREWQLNWGTTGQFLNKRTDPSGAVSTWIYTSNQALTFGVPDSLKDANSLTTSWTYDAFGRKTKETRPDSTSTTWAWSACTSECGWSNSVYQIAQTAYQTNGTTAIRTDTNSYDPLDRVTQSASPTVAGKTATVQSLYNSLGLLTQRSLPFLSGATAYQQKFAYDVLNRPTSVTRPISSTNSTPQATSYGYMGRTSTATDPYGNVKTTISDVNGWQRKTKDAVGYVVTQAYDAAGSLTGITDSAGNTLLKNVSVAYGVKPFITAATDADRGAWTYSVDSLGERTGWTDAKGQAFSMTYDALSRPLTREEPDLFTEWNYGSAAPNWGRLTSECTQSSSTANLCTTTGSSWLYNEIRAYDSLGRLSTRSITQSLNPGNDAGGAFLYTLSYSATTGLLNALTYPKSTSSFALSLEYGYGYGLLQSVTDTSDATATCGSTCVLWTANAQNAFGEITQETLGNGVVTNRSYDAVTSWLTAATAGVRGGAGLLNQSYLQDKNGNVIQREATVGTASLYENLYYDADNRLCAIVLGGTGSCSSSTIVYDDGNPGPGNITNQPGVGRYAYPAAGQPRPHAVTSITGTFNGITNPTFSYDANGNMTDRASSTANIYWSSYNYPTSLAASDITGSEEVQFNYGPDRQRWKQIYTGPSGTEQTYYLGKNLEVVFNGTTNYRHYIYAGAEPVAVYSRTSAGVNTMSYMLEDHQGGVSAITSSTGAADVDESFSAFGTRRNPSTWSGAPTTSDLNAIASLSRQGYTFQTWLGQSMGLNHMNGRVQDAILWRFLSPDPFIPDPANAQSYNRYSYVNNNPLSFTDSTGFSQSPKCKDYCPSTGARFWNFTGGGSALDGLIGWQSFGDLSDGVSDDTGALTDWFNSASSAIQGTGGSGELSGTVPEGAPAGDPSPGETASQSGGLAQSQAAGGSTTFVDPNDATAGIVATASMNSSITYGAQQTGNFACGSGTCYWQMGSYVNTQFSFPLRGATLQVKGPGIPNGSKWKQIYIGTGLYDTGQPVQDCSDACPFYTGPGTNSQNFFDASARYDSSANWFAMTTLVGPNGNPLVTFTWGFQLSSGGILLTLPQVVPQ